jgi:hypothetical protein
MPPTPYADDQEHVSSSTKRMRPTSLSPANQELPPTHRRRLQVDSTDDDWASLGYIGKPLKWLTIIITIDCKIVGVQYYSGIVYLSESLRLIREPDNEFDDNAIRVDNSCGTQVGQYLHVLICQLTTQYSSRLCYYSGIIFRQCGIENRRDRDRAGGPTEHPYSTPTLGSKNPNDLHAPSTTIPV